MIILFTRSGITKLFTHFRGVGGLEFDSDESVENDGIEDDTRTNSYDEPQLAPEALFLIGRRSRFGRTIRFNGRFVQ